MSNTFQKYNFFVKKNNFIIFFSVENLEGEKAACCDSGDSENTGKIKTRTQQTTNKMGSLFVAIRSWYTLQGQTH